MSAASKWIAIALGLILIVVVMVAVNQHGTPKKAALFPPAIAAGGGHSCRIVNGGTVECWGANFSGQLGNGRITPTSPLSGPVSGLTKARVITAGSRNHTCAITDALGTGAVLCWGENGQGQLGNGGTVSSSTPVDSGVRNAVDIAAGADFTCAVMTNGTTSCWGSNAFGQFGNGTKIGSSTPTASSATNVKSIAAGAAHVCVALNNGAAQCWGTGPLGIAGLAQSLAPANVSGLANVTALSASASNTCALLADGSVKCWGGNSQGELGTTSTARSDTPVAVYGIQPTGTGNSSPATAIAVGGSHACAVMANRQVKCWGSNASGQVGIGDLIGPDNCGSSPTVVMPCSRLPVPLPGINDAIDVAAGDSHTCALLPGSQVKCWGWNGFGQIGNGAASALSSVAEPVPKVLIPTWVTRKSIVASAPTFGGGVSCAQYPSGAVKCWGSNTSGQLGNGTTAPGLPGGVATAAAVTGLNNALGISVGGAHSCSLLSNSTMQCWGDSGFGAAGSSAAAKQNLPIAVAGLPANVVTIGTGRSLSCAILSGIGTGGSRSLRCWGVNNNGQLGVSNTGMSSCGTSVLLPCSTTPIQVPITAPVAVAGGDEHTCALREDGRVLCWGQNLFGQLGRMGNSQSPDVVTGISNAIAIAVGSSHNCALLARGTFTSVSCWGRNRFGQLGNGLKTTETSTNTMPTTTPVEVPGLINATAIAAGAEFSCALLSDGTVKCWGSNGVGSLGVATVPLNGCAATNNPCSLVPITVAGLSSVVALATSGSSGHVCAILEDGSAQCWGSNSAGELGRGTIGGLFATPAAVTGL